MPARPIVAFSGRWADEAKEQTKNLLPAAPALENFPA